MPSNNWAGLERAIGFLGAVVTIAVFVTGISSLKQCADAAPPSAQSLPAETQSKPQPNTPSAPANKTVQRSNVTAAHAPAADPPVLNPQEAEAKRRWDTLVEYGHALAQKQRKKRPTYAGRLESGELSDRIDIPDGYAWTFRATGEITVYYFGEHYNAWSYHSTGDSEADQPDNNRQSSIGNPTSMQFRNDMPNAVEVEAWVYGGDADAAPWSAQSRSSGASRFQLPNPP